MFKTFPQFSRLTLADRDEYEEFIKNSPPIADISFPTMLTWWDGIGSADVSTLNGNLVISFWVPGDEEHSGLSLVGVNQVEESICEVFDYLRGKGERPRLVNVPEFVVHGLRYPELFTFISQRNDDEYVIPLARLSSLESIPPYQRVRIKRFMKRHSRQELAVKSLDLSRRQNKDLLFESAEKWPKEGFNDLGSVEKRVLRHTIEESENLDIKNACLFIDGSLQAYCLYHQTHDPKYIVTDHARINYDISNIFDYMAYAFSRYVLERQKEVAFVNVHADLGVARLRVFKLALRPVNFFRKYTIEPARIDRGVHLLIDKLYNM